VRTPTSPRRTAALLLGALCVPAALGACSSSSTSGGATTTTRATGHQGASSVCSLVTPADIRTVLGRSVKAPTVRNTTAATICTYAATHASTPTDAVIIGFRGQVTAAAAAAEQTNLAKLHGTVTDVTGSGAQAYYYSVGTGAHSLTTLVSLVGETQVTVTSTAPVTQAEALSTLIFGTFASAATSTTSTTAPG
jgi:hypothetical protein